MKILLYSEIVKRLRNHERLSINEMNGFQLLMLLQDKEIKRINSHGNIFEINFIPITYAFNPCILKEEELSSYKDGEKIIEDWIHCYNIKRAIYVQIEDEYFEVILDLLESAE